MLFKTAALFKCRCKYSLLIKGASRIIWRLTKWTFHIYKGAEGVSLEAQIFPRTSAPNVTQRRLMLWISGDQQRPKKKKKKKKLSGITCCFCSWEMKSRIGLCCPWQDNPASLCMFTTCHTWCQLRFDASISQSYLQQHIPFLLSVCFFNRGLKLND